MAFAAEPCLRICFDAGDAIVLDLAKNRYSAVPHAGERPDAEGRFAALLESRFGAQPRSLQERARAVAHADLNCFGRPRPRLRALDWARFLRACVSASYELHRGRIDLLFDRWEARRRRLKAPRTSETLQSRLDRFVAMRPWWPRKRKCLFESIALADFLAAEGVGADIVFGVMARAFEAHCWLEFDGVVLNDDLERVAPYRVICWS